MTPSIVHACCFSAEFGRHFVSSLERLREECRGQGLDSVAIFPESARKRPWCRAMAAGHWRLHFLPDDASRARCAWSIAVILSRENARLIHTHYSDFDAAAWLAAALAGLAGSRSIRVVWHLHSEARAGDSLPQRLKDAIKYRCMGRSARIFVASDHLKERPLLSGFEPERMHVIPTGLDLRRPEEAGSLDDPFSVLGVKRNAAVLMCGWKPFVKGVDVALAAFEIVTRTRSDLSLLIVGRERTREEVLRLYPNGMPPWLRLIPPVDDFAYYLRGAGIFLSASRREGFPYRMFEAISSRCLIVSSDIPAMRWLKGSVRFWWFRGDDPADLAGRIIDCANLREKERREAVRVNSEFVRKYFSVKDWALSIAMTYAMILCQAAEL